MQKIHPHTGREMQAAWEHLAFITQEAYLYDASLLLM